VCLQGTAPVIDSISGVSTSRKSALTYPKVSGARTPS